MASNKKREIRFTLTNDDYLAFGRYRIMYTEQGRKMVGRQRLTFLLTAVMIAILFTVFHVDKNFTKIMYVLAAILAVVGLFFAEKLVLRQQERAIKDAESSPERVHQTENRINFEDTEFITTAGNDIQTFSYADIKLIDLTEEAIYVWMSDTMIMPLPLHAFKSMSDMKDCCKWLRKKTEEKAE